MGNSFSVRKKRFNPKDRIIYEGACYHLIQRAPGKDVLFLEDKDYLYFLHLLKEIQNKFSYKIFCFCLMPNHLHLLLQIKKCNLALGMKSLFTRYALYFNYKYERKGHVFYGRYRPFLCQDEYYRLAASVYIHLNPFKAGLINDLLKYRWSSLSAYLNLPSRTFLAYKEILSILGKSAAEGTSAYKDILEHGTGLGYKSIIEDPKAVDKFVLGLHKKVREFMPGLKNSVTDFEKCLDLIKDKKRLSQAEDIAARKYLIEQLRSRGYELKEIAERLNLSRQTVFLAMKA